MGKFFNKFKKTLFWPILGPFSQFWEKKRFLAPCKNYYSKNTILRIHLDTEGRKGKRMYRPYFIRPLQLVLGVELIQPIRTTSTKTKKPFKCKDEEAIWIRIFKTIPVKYT